MDNIHQPRHYTYRGIECKEVQKIMTSGLSGVIAYYVGCAIKYLYRWPKKNGVEDLKKAREYLNMAINELEREENQETSGRFRKVVDIAIKEVKP